jgi:DNA processing protein
MAALNLRFIVPGDPEWPLGLDSLGYCEVGEMAGPPIGLWLAGPGRLSDYVKTRAGGPPTEAAVATELTQTAISVAVVGSRAATAYGEHVAAEMAAGLAERGLAVISGGAYGIDAAAHRAALAVGGRTLALMAGGLAQVYPPGNARLLEQIRAEQLLISEHPPTRRPSRPRFLARNRLIAALTQATVVVEGGVRSGAANTLRWALGLQRPVLAVPGPVTSALSATPHRLIRDGEAILVTSADDVIAAVEPLDPGREQRPTARPRRLDALAGTDRTIYEDLPRRGRVSVDELALRTGFTTLEVMTSLGRLAQQELVETTAEGWWRLVKS